MASANEARHREDFDMETEVVPIVRMHVIDFIGLSGSLPWKCLVQQIKTVVMLKIIAIDTLR